jgi:hypothetical protein
VLQHQGNIDVTDLRSLLEASQFTELYKSRRVSTALGQPVYGVIWVHVFKLGTIGKTQCKLPVKPAWTTEYLLSYIPNLDVRYVSNIMYESGYIRTFNGI